MDLERGIIKAFFYDYPLERYVDIVSGEMKDEHAFIEYLPEILKWEMKAFNVQELTQTKETYLKDWEQRYAGYPETVWPLMFVANTAQRLLTKINDKPRVQEGQLLRWRMISLPVSEDLISLAWLAWNERSANIPRTNFVWEDTIPVSDHERVCFCGNNGLCDIHAHLGASSDAFNIRWIYWMNHVIPKIEGTMKWMGVASIIRYYLFEICNGGKVEKRDKEDILDAFGNRVSEQVLFNLIYGEIDGAKDDSLKPNIGQLEHWDYAITPNMVIPNDDIVSPYMMHVGERYVMYEFLRQLYLGKKEAVDFAEYFYIYLLIKNHYRKSYIQTNDLIGLSNYQEYEGRNRVGIDYMGEARKRYALQSALGEKNQNYLESRISWNWNKQKEKSPVPNIYLEQSLFGTQVGNRENLLKKVRMVVSFSKSDFNFNKKSEEIHALTVTFDEIISRIAKNKSLEKQEFCVVGIDFTGSDKKVRPEVYAQLVRYARRHHPIAMNQFTYHAGEDFYDLMDGLRTIDEVLRYLKWDKHCRLGHALALATSPFQYYDMRGWNVIATKQILLDNLVWFLEMSSKAEFRVLKAVKQSMIDEIKKLYGEIGYIEPFSLDKYTQSMKLRGDHPVGAGRDDGMSLFVQTALDDDAALMAIRENCDVNEIFREYYEDQEVRKKGEILTFWKMPREVVSGIQRIQKFLLKAIKDKNIAIEVCPTSNYMIGYFDKYSELPLFTFIKELPDNAISINTDDKGVISTSIENEYALIGMAMSKKRKYRSKINVVLNRIRNDAKKSRFEL